MTQRDGMNCPKGDRSLALLPAIEAVAPLLATEAPAPSERRPVRFSVLRPPYPALGLGTLRVLRVRERAGGLDIVAGYDGYERLDSGARSGRKP